LKINILPKDDKTNGWSALLAERKPKAHLKGDVYADWVVLGAGYAGLAAARRLGELHPDQKVIVLDAGAAGENASGRNSGFAIDLPHNVGSSLEELDGSHRFMRLARFAIDRLDDLVQTHGIACDWSRDGKYHAAVSPKGVIQVLQPFAHELTALGEPFEWVEGAALAQRLGSSHFNAAIFTPGGRLMNPAGLTRGLADTLPQNVTLCENSPVVGFDNINGVELRCPEGSIRAPKMIMAANGFSDQFGFFKNKLLHLVAHGSLTRPLTQQERMAYGVEKPWGMTPANAFAGITMRYTNDHRILIRYGLEYCPKRRFDSKQLASVRQKHQDLFDARFPTLKGVMIEHTWSGFVCLSQNAAPGFGQLESNIWSAVCQNAVGVTKGTFGGTLAAEMASGQDHELISDMLSLGQPSAMPPRPFLDLGVRSRFAWELFSNRHEA